MATQEINQTLSDNSGEITGYSISAADVVYPQVDETLTIRGKAADAKAVGDKFIAAKEGQPQNLLDNSRFGTYYVINQRGVASGYSGDSAQDTYFFDRWKTTKASCTYTWTGATLTITNGDTSSARGMYQYFENARYRLGTRTVTVVMNTSAGQIVGKITLPENDTLPSSGTYYTVVEPIGNKPGARFYVAKSWDCYFQITVAPSQTVQIYNVGVYMNDLTNNPPDYVGKGYAAELNECRRYFTKSSIMLHTTAVGFNSCTGEQFPIKMRAVPSIKLFGLNNEEGCITVYSGSEEILPCGVIAIRQDGFARVYRNTGTFSSTQTGVFYSYEASADI